MFYNFRWFYNYSGGQLTNFGVHYMDMMRWCLGKEYAARVTAMGGKYVVKDNREIPDTLEVIWEFDGTLVMFAQYNANAAPGNPQGRRWNCAAPRARCTFTATAGRWCRRRSPIKTSYARTPLDRESEKAYKPSQEPMIEAA